MSRLIGHRALASLALTLLVASCSSASAAETARAIAGMSAADFARYSEGREFYGAYLFGHKMGWIGAESRVIEYQGVPLSENRAEIHFQAEASDKDKQLHVRTTTRYSLQGNGEITSITEIESEGAGEIQRSAVREGANLRITSREKNGKTSERVVPLPRDTLARQRDHTAWLASPRKKGDKFTLYELDLAEEKIESETVMEFIAAEPLLWGGVAVKASRVRMHVSGLDFTALVAPDGKLLRGKVGGLVDIRAEEEQVAKAFDDKPVDMLAASSIQVDKPLGDRTTMTTLTLELSGLGASQLPTSARQRVQGIGKGRAIVELSRETTAEAAPLTAAERTRFLRATPSVQSDDATIRDLAARIAGDEKDPVKVAQLIVNWIAANLRPAYGADANTATAVLAQKTGDCTEHTLLFTALARAAGIPTRQLGGIIYVEDPAPLFGWHAWAEIHDGHGWVSVDPTWRQLRVDPTHVQFSFSGDDLDRDRLGWISVIGELKIKVRKVTRG